MAVGTNLQSVLGGRQLSRAINLVKSGVPSDHLPAALLTPTEGIEGVNHTMRQYTGTRKTLRRAEYGAASRRHTPKGVKEQPVVLNHFSENISIKAATLINLESDNGDRQRLGEQEVARQVAEARTVIDNTRVSSVAFSLALGKIHYNSDGELLSSSSGAQYTVDYGIPAGNLNQVAMNGGSTIFAQSWTGANAKIHQHMIELHKRYPQYTGYKIGAALYGSNILNYLVRNDDVRAYTKNSPQFQSSFYSGMVIPDGFLGVEKWYPAYQSHYEKEDGTIAEIFDPDSITFIPTPSTEWYGMVEGTTPVPGSFGTSKPDLSSVLADVSTQRGRWSYAYGTVDPVGATMVFGDTSLPEILVPNAVVIAKVGY